MAKEYIRNINEVHLLGNVTRKFDLREFGDNCVLNFGVATNRNSKDKATGEWVKKTEFHNLVLWGELGRKFDAKYSKGDIVEVKGELVTEKYQDKKTGEDKYTTKIKVLEVVGLGTAWGDAKVEVKAKKQDDEVDF